MDSEELLAQLADIHLPEPIGLWPPAPGWWILGLLILLGLAYLGRRWYLSYQRKLILRQALAELDGCASDYAHADSDDDKARVNYVNAVNTVMRRVALVHYSDQQVAALSGREWVDFIRKNGDSSRLDDDVAAALSHGRFQTRCEVDVDTLHAVARDWIKSLYQHRPRLSAA